MSSYTSTQEIETEIITRLGFLPPFFKPAKDSLQIFENLWNQTLASYIENPMPPLFKEKLAAYLARECTIPYCLIVHSCSLRPLGMTAKQVLSLLSRRDLKRADIEECVIRLKSSQPISDWPEANSDLETLFFESAICIFFKLNTGAMQKELRRVMGENFYAHLTLFLSYIQLCHKWAESHPELAYEADSRAIENLQPLLTETPELATFFETYQVSLRQRIIDREDEILSNEFRTIFLEKGELELEKMRAEMLEARVHERTVALQLARDEAVRANALKTEWLSTISHEIRTPMYGILGLSEMLLHETEGATKETAGQVFNVAENLMVLVNDLLDMSKLESGQFTIIQDQFSVTKLLRTAINNFEVQARHKGLELEITQDPDVPDVLFGDKIRVGQILNNLISNAVKFTDKGTISIATKLLEKTKTDQIVRFEVSDTGIGISQEDQKRLFKVFGQLDGSYTRRHGGSGLGLAICDRLLKLMDGKIMLESKVDIGTKFMFDISFAIHERTG